MANRPHVPKFGDWNNQDQPFTVVFDNARTTKRQDLYESIENSDIKPQAKPTPPPQQPQPAPRTQRPVPPRPVRDDTPRAPPPQPERNRVRAPPPNQLYQGGGGGGGGRSAGRDGNGLYGGYGGGDGAGTQRQPPAPRPPVQPKRNTGRAGGGTTIPPFPGSLGAGENMSYTHIFDQVKEERREGARASYSGSTGHTPSRPINGKHESPAPNSSKVCCFPWFRRGSKY